jgi:exonuclease III
MATATMNIVSLNVNGLRNNLKRKALFRQFKERKFDIVCIQESYITESVADRWKQEWGGDVVFSEGTCRSKGQLVLIRKHFKYEWSAEIVTQRVIVIRVKTDLGEVCVCNAYAPCASPDLDSFFTEITDTLSNIEHDQIIVCGDFNAVLNNDLDIISGEKHADKTVQLFNNFVDNCGLSDTWRLFNPNDRDFTWSRKINGMFVARRLDYILTSDDIVDNICECNIASIPQTDHRCVYIQLSCCNTERGPGYWKMNNALLKEENFLNLINTTIEDSLAEETVANKPDDFKWEFLKLRIKEAAIQYSKQRAVFKKNHYVELQTKLKQCESVLVHNPQNIDAINEREHLLVQCALEEQEKVKSAQTRARVKWISDGDKNTKYFFELRKI